MYLDICINKRLKKSICHVPFDNQTDDILDMFVVYQETFFRTMVKSQIIRPLRLPDATESILLGYANETNILIINERGLIKVYKIVSLDNRCLSSPRPEFLSVV